MHRLQICLLTATICCSLPHSLLAAESKVGTTQTIPMTSGHWRPVSDKPDVHYVTQEGFPDGIIVLKSGDLALNGLTFRDGTIDFDMKPLAEDIPGIRFRQRDPQDGEEFYIRSLPDCRAGMKTAVDAVNELVTVSLSQGQFDGLVDLWFNCGQGNFRNSTLLRKVNAGDFAGAVPQFDGWVYSGGKVESGLVTSVWLKRRPSWERRTTCKKRHAVQSELRLSS